MKNLRHGDISGHRYGKLVALKQLNKERWLFRCDCGKEIDAQKYYVTSGAKKSCGMCNPIKCAVCGNEFYSSYHSRYCSPDCQKVAERERRKVYDKKRKDRERIGDKRKKNKRNPKRGSLTDDVKKAHLEGKSYGQVQAEKYVQMERGFSWVK